MFLLGHSCWSYLFSKATGRKLNVNLPAYLALLSGILPDFDIYFQPYLPHHTYTHSLLFAGDKSIPLAELAFSRRALTVITLGHILLSGILALGVLQGFRWYLGNRRLKQMATVEASSAQPLG